jgi:hypothetical protein
MAKDVSRGTKKPAPPGAGHPWKKHNPGWLKRDPVTPGSPNGTGSNRTGGRIR